MLRSMLTSSGSDFVPLGLEQQPRVIAIPITSKKLKKLKALKNEEQIVYGSRAPTTAGPPPPADGASQVRRIRIKTIRVPQPTPTAASEEQPARAPALILVAPSSNAWLPVDATRPRVQPHPVRVVPTPDASSARPVHSTRYTQEQVAAIRQSGFRQVDAPRMADLRPAHIPPAEVSPPPKPGDLHPAFRDESKYQGVTKSGFIPMEPGKPKLTSGPVRTEPLDYGTDIITIYDVNKNQKSEGSNLKVVGSTLKVKGEEAQRGKVFDDVIYDYNSGDDYKPQASGIIFRSYAPKRT